MTTTANVHLQTDDATVTITDLTPFGAPGTLSLKIGQDSALTILTRRTGIQQLATGLANWLISTEPDEPIHIPSDVAAPLGVEK